MASRTQLASVPAPLQSAIDAASTTYASKAGVSTGLFSSLLDGIWRWESGSTYPNPAKNSSGYGGLFGTTDAYGPTQEQANLAASILATGFQQAGGSEVGALSYYNTGRVSSASGAAYAQKVIGVSGDGSGASTPIVPGPGSTVTLGGTPIGTVRPRPSGGGGGSFWGGVETAAEIGAAPLTGGLSLLPAVWGAGGSLAKGAEDLISGPLAFLKAALWLVNPVNWLRGFEIILGTILVVGGILHASGVDSKIAGGAAKVAGSAAGVVE